MLFCLHRTHGKEPPQTKEGQKQDPQQHQEWFTKYFSF